MTVHDFSVGAREHGDLESELADAAADPLHRSVVLSGIAGVENQAVSGADLNFDRGL
jgi:hypothetical protein